MSSFDAAAWANTSTDTDNQPAPDPGLYEALLAEARAFTSNSGKDFVVLSWRVASGPQAGREWDVLFGFGSDGAVKVTKATLVRLGIDVDAIRNLDEMDTAVKAAVGEWYAVEVKQNGEYRNTYINSKITAPAPASDVPADPGEFAAAAAGAKADETIPF